jgi:hypothetical protein
MKAAFPVCNMKGLKQPIKQNEKAPIAVHILVIVLLDSGTCTKIHIRFWEILKKSALFAGE